MKKRVTLSGFPEVGFTAKAMLPPAPGRREQPYVFVKVGTGELGSADFVIEIESDTDGPVTDRDMLAAMELWQAQVEDLQLRRLRGLVAEVQQEQTITV